MEEICKDVILCKGEKGLNEGHDSYTSVFEAAGYSCQVLPTLSFSFVNTQKLQNCLETPELFSGIILTSQRSVEAIKHAIRNKPLQNSWRELPVYCVGPATENQGKNTLYLSKCMGSQSGNAQELAKFIISNHKKGERSLLYPCSNIARETIQQILEEAQITVEKIIAYETLPSETLEDDVLRMMKDSPQIIVFFSPSIVKNVVAIADRHNLTSRIKSVAIGPVTAEALKNHELKIYATAAKPESGALLQCIQNAQILSI